MRIGTSSGQKRWKPVIGPPAEEHLGTQVVPWILIELFEWELFSI